MKRKIGKVELWLQNGCSPIIRTMVECYTKGEFYCMYKREDNLTEKYPLCTIFKVVESYNLEEE